MDIKSVCGTVNLGSNPSTLANLRSDNMNEIKIKIKEEREETGTNCRIISINGISGFWKHPRHENCWIYNGRMPMANCWIFISDNSIKLLNKIKEIKEFNIGHFIIGESIFNGFSNVIKRFIKLSNN